MTTDTDVDRHAQIDNRALTWGDLDFGAPQAEALNLRSGLGVVQRQDLALLEIGGKDRSAWLQRLVSADLKRLEVGQGTPAALLTAKGRIVAHFSVLVAETHIGIIVDRSQDVTLVAALEKLAVFDDVTIAAQPVAMVGVYGPELGRLERFGGAPMAPYAHRSQHVFGVDATLVEDDSLAVPGRLFVAPVEEAATLRAELVEAGAKPAGLAAYEICRIEAGSPRAGAELTQGVMLLEAGQLDAVSFDKGCYIGQEPVCRVHSRGQVNYRLSGFESSGQQALAAGEVILAEDDSEAGNLTSVALSPTLGKWVALGYLHRKHCELGSRLKTATGGELTVVSLPHVDGVAPRTCPRFKE